MFEPVYREIFPFWNEISPETRDTICQNSVAMTYLKGTTIHDGTECSGVFFIRSGCLRVYLLSEKGKDTPYTACTPGTCACFPPHACCSPSPST